MTIIDIHDGRTNVWQSIDLRDLGDLHPYAKWEEDEEDEEQPVADQTTELVLTNGKLLDRRLHEAVDPTWR